MKKLILGVSIVGVSLLSSESFAAILSPSERLERIEKATSITSREVKIEEVANAKERGNPFKEKEKVLLVEKEVVQVVSDTISDEELIDLLLPLIRPTGVFAVGNGFILMIEEKQLKNGAPLNLKYLNTEYQMILEEISRSVITVRYGDATRQIKLQ